jgi:putative ubiquitin-RnfH superfamily antitoxin RatB of RatAB toxin-antitoxin module
VPTPEVPSAKPVSTIRVEVVYAEPQRRIVRIAIVAAEATVEDAIGASAIREELPAGFAPASIGIFGRVVALDASLRDGDRIELYRPLRIDPKQARRRRAEKQK